jgi:hypothetical protein
LFFCFLTNAILYKCLSVWWYSFECESFITPGLSTFECESFITPGLSTFEWEFYYSRSEHVWVLEFYYSRSEPKVLRPGVIKLSLKQISSNRQTFIQYCISKKKTNKKNPRFLCMTSDYIFNFSHSKIINQPGTRWYFLLC